MKKKLLYTLLIILLIANSALLFLILNKGPKHQGPQKQNFLTEELQFSEEQEDQFFLLDKDHRNSMRLMDDELMRLRKQLFNSFDRNDFIPDSITKRMGELETLKQKELFTFFKDVRKLCDENQAIKFDEIIERVLRNRAPKPPENGRKGPPRKDF